MRKILSILLVGCSACSADVHPADAEHGEYGEEQGEFADPAEDVARRQEALHLADLLRRRRPRRDASAPSVDSGTAKPDSGLSADAGTPGGSAPVDAGTRTPDSGPAPSDAGMGAVDSGTGVHDASAPAIDSGGGSTRAADCAGLGATGVFEEITPPQVKAGMSSTRDGGGTFAIAVDPVNAGTLYLGTRYQKFWKSTDCGATWTQIATGRNAAHVNTGMNWTLAVDPLDPEVVYTNAGYGAYGFGLYKSANGGVDWDVVWPPPAQPDLARAFQYNFANVVALDPGDHRHLLLTFHEACLPPHPSTCIAESSDGGATWRLIDGRPEWNGNEGQVIFFLENSSTWLWGSQFNGFWRSGDRGASWEVIPRMTTSHIQGSQLQRAQDGTFYMAGADGIWRSPDGRASTWTLIPDTGPIVGGLVSSGVNLFASTCWFPNFCTSARYLRSAESDGQTWTTLPGPNVSMGGTMAYDEVHGVLYSSNLTDGLWRVVVR